MSGKENIARSNTMQHIMNELIAVISTNLDAIISLIIHYPTIAIPMIVVAVFLFAAFKN